MKNKSLGNNLTYLSYIVAAIMIIGSIYIRFQCVDCSETRLFIDNWRAYVGGLALYVALSVYGLWNKY